MSMVPRSLSSLLKSVVTSIFLKILETKKIRTILQAKTETDDIKLASLTQNEKSKYKALR